MASFSTFNDPMTISTQNTTLWGGNFGTLSWTGGGFTITNPINYTGYGGETSNSAYDLTAAACYCSMANVGNQSLASCETVPVELVSGTSSLQWYVNGGTLTAYKNILGAGNISVASTPYNSAVHKWFSIAEGTGRKSGVGTSGTVYFDYSTDGITWTLLGSLLNPFAVTALTVQPSLGTFNNEASSTTAKWNSFNTPPTVVGSSFSNIMMMGV